jgi:hypothetical protein
MEQYARLVCHKTPMYAQRQSTAKLVDLQVGRKAPAAGAGGEAEGSPPSHRDLQPACHVSVTLVVVWITCLADASKRIGYDMYKHQILNYFR